MATRDDWQRYEAYKMLFNMASDGFFEDRSTQIQYNPETGEYFLSVRYQSTDGNIHVMYDAINLEETPGEAFKRYANVMLEGVYGEK